MKHVMGFAAKVLFFALVAGLLAMNAAFGLQFVTRLFPDNWIIQYGSLLLFDGGALIWFLVFLFDAKGAGQRGTALLGTIIDLCGAFTIAATEVFTAGEAWLTDPSIAGQMRQTAMYILILWLIINVIFIYLHHATNPKTMQEIELQSIQDETMSQAMEIAKNNSRARAVNIAMQLGQQMEADSLASLQRETGVRLIGAPSVIDGEFAQPSPMRLVRNPNHHKPRNILERVGGLFAKKEPEFLAVANTAVSPASGYAPNHVDGINNGEGIPVTMGRTRNRAWKNRVTSMAYQQTVPAMLDPTDQRKP